MRGGAATTPVAEPPPTATMPSSPGRARPWAGWSTWSVAAIVLLVNLPWPHVEAGGSTVTAADLASLALVTVVVAGLIAGRFDLPRPAAVVLGALAAAATVSALVATDTGAALSGLVRYLQVFVLVPAAVAAVVRTPQRIAVVAGAFVVSGLLQGAVGVVQYLSGTGASIGGETVRAVGTFGAQEIMAMSAVVSFGLAVCVAGAVALTDLRHRIVLTGLAVALLVPLAFSLSRGSWLASAVVLVLLLAHLGPAGLLRAAGVVTALAVVLVGGFGLGGGEIGTRLGSAVSSVGSPDSSVGDRYHLWDTATSIWSEHPVTGAGLRSFPELRDGHAPLGLNSSSDTDQPGAGYVKQELLSPHNQYLLVLSEQGLLGATALVGLLATVALGTLQRVRRSTTPTERAVGLAVLGMVLWQAVEFLYADTGGPTSVLVGVVVGLAASYGLRNRPGSGAPGVTGRPGTRSGRGSGEARMVLTATVVSAVLIALGSLGGVVRDLMLASYFGADGTTDAFLVAWTIAESAVPLLIDGAMALLLVPAFTRALAVAEPGAPTSDPRAAVAGVVSYALPRLALGLVVVAGIVAVTAPWLVGALAPGLAQPELGVQAMRVVAASLVFIGLAGFAAGALRAHLVFGPPAAISLAFNVGIVGSILLFHERLGVLSAAIGVTAGAVLMVAVQLPSYLRRIPVPRAVLVKSSLISVGAFLPIAVYTLTRQAQVYVERFVGSTLAEGTISHLNYAQKIGQLPSTLALIIAVVTFPLLARSLVAGDAGDARRRLEADVRIVGAVVLLSTTFLFVFAPQVVQLLFERGAFTAADTADTAAILRIYVFGLLGQALVELVCRALFTGRSTFLPAATMGVGLVVTAVVAGIGASVWGAPGIAAGNAAGISVTAVGLLLTRRSRAQAIDPRAIGVILLRLLPAVAVTAAIGVGIASLVRGLPGIVAVPVGGTAMMVVFAAVAMATGGLPSVRAVLGTGSAS